MIRDRIDKLAGKIDIENGAVKRAFVRRLLRLRKASKRTNDQTPCALKVVPKVIGEQVFILDDKDPQTVQVGPVWLSALTYSRHRRRSDGSKGLQDCTQLPRA
jgi:hypothetical protein